MQIIITNIQKRVLLYSLSSLCFIAIVLFGWVKYSEAMANKAANETRLEQENEVYQYVKSYRELVEKFTSTKTEYLDIDLTTDEAVLIEIKTNIVARQLEGVSDLIESTSQSVDAKVESKKAELAEEAKRGDLTGNVKIGNVSLPAVKISLFSEENLAAETQTDESGSYKFHIEEGTYQVKVSKDGYNNYSKSVEIKAQIATTLSIALSVKTIAATAPASSSNAQSATVASDGVYEKNKRSNSRQRHIYRLPNKI